MEEKLRKLTIEITGNYDEEMIYTLIGITNALKEDLERREKEDYYDGFAEPYTVEFESGKAIIMNNPSY